MEFVGRGGGQEAEGASATWQLPSQPRLAPPAELRRGARAAAAVSEGSHVVISAAVAPTDDSVRGEMESGGNESGGDESEIAKRRAP